MVTPPNAPKETPEGRFQVRWYGVDGKRHSRTFTDEKVAASFLRAEERLKEQGLVGGSGLGLKKTLNYWADIWFAEVTRNGPQTPVTLQDYRYKYDRHIRPTLGKLKVKTITQETIEEWAADLRAVSLAHTSIKANVTIVSKVIQHIHRRCKCLDRPNPTRGAQLGPTAGNRSVVDRPGVLDDDEVPTYWLFHPLSFEEVDELADAIAQPKYAGLREVGRRNEIFDMLNQGMTQYAISKRLGIKTSLVNFHAKNWKAGYGGRSYPEYNLLIRFLAWTGLRIGELCALRVDDITLDDEGDTMIRVRHSIGNITKANASLHKLDGTRLRNPTKSKKERIVPLPVFLRAEIAELIHGRAGQEPVFTSPTGLPLSANAFRSGFYNPAAEKVGKAALRIHDLRHTYVSMLIHRGATASEVCSLVGHSNPAFTLRVYAHLFPEQRKQAVARLNQAWIDDQTQRKLVTV